MSWLSRIVNAVRSSGVDRALDDEMTFHIESRIGDLVAAGMTQEAAEAMARRQFGNRLRHREQSRDVKLRAADRRLECREPLPRADRGA